MIKQIAIVGILGLVLILATTLYSQSAFAVCSGTKNGGSHNNNAVHHHYKYKHHYQPISNRVIAD